MRNKRKKGRKEEVPKLRRIEPPGHLFHQGIDHQAIALCRGLGISEIELRQLPCNGHRHVYTALAVPQDTCRGAEYQALKGTRSLCPQIVIASLLKSPCKEEELEENKPV